MGSKKNKKKKDHPLKDALKNASDGVKQVVQNMGHNLNGSVRNLVEDIDNAGQWLALAPFKRGMQMVLKSRGYPVPDKIDQVAKSFFAHIIQKKNFEEYFSVHQAAVKLGRHSARVRENFIASHFEQPENFAVAAVVAGAKIVIPIVREIIQWFNQRKMAKKMGQPIPADEEAASNDAENTLSNTSGIGAPAYGAGGRPGANTYTPNAPVGAGGRGGATGFQPNTSATSSEGNVRDGTKDETAAPPAEEEGVSLFTIIMIAVGVVLVVIIIAMV